MSEFNVSVIVSAYNEEKYIERCLNSLVAQTLGHKLEIIVMDDGSTDNTLSICHYYASKYSNICVYHQENQGQGPAREHAIALSQGEYIGFCDADDYAETNMFSILYEFAKKNNDDIVVCDVHKIFKEEGYEETVKSLDQSSGSISIGEYIRKGLSNAYLHNKIFKREIWNHYHFKNMVYEDLDIVLTIISYEKRVGYVQEPLYNYYKHANTTTSSYTNPRLFDIFKAYKDIPKNINPQYLSEAVYQIAVRILRNMNTPGFLYYCADFIELIHSLKSYFINNKYILEDEEVSQILYYLNINTIPNNLYSQVPLSDIWTTMGNHPTIYYEQDKSVLLKQLYKQGGLLINGPIELKSPYDALRTSEALYKDGECSILSVYPHSPVVYKMMHDQSFNLPIKSLKQYIK